MLQLLRRKVQMEMTNETSTVREYWPAYRTYFAAFLIFISSRGVVLLAIAFAAKFVPQNSQYTGTADAGLPWYQYLLRWDAGWYLTIVYNGYSYNGNDLEEQNVVFFPLYPLLTKFIALFGISKELSLLLVSNVSILIAIPLLCKLIKDEYGDEVALYTLALVSFFPTSLFFSAGYAEALAFLLIVCFFLFLKQERYFLAAVSAGLASATRSVGIVLLLPLLWELWLHFGLDRKRLLLSTAVYTTLATSGCWFYMLYLGTAFNSPLAFMRGQRAYLGGGEIGSNLTRVLTLQPFVHLADISHRVRPTTLAPWFFLLFLLLTAFFWRRLSTSFGLFALGILLLPYLTLSWSPTLGFNSFTRYILLAFPVFIVMGDLFKKKLWLGLGVTGFFAAMLFMYTALFAQWYWVM